MRGRHAPLVGGLRAHPLSGTRPTLPPRPHAAGPSLGGWRVPATMLRASAQAPLEHTAPAAPLLRTQATTPRTPDMCGRPVILLSQLVWVVALHQTLREARG
jgi:hypothetical protein